MPFDMTPIEVEAVPQHDLATPRGRLLYLRDVVVPGIPAGHIAMEKIVCGTVACLGGWASLDPKLRHLGVGKNRGAVRGGKLLNGWDQFFGLSRQQGTHLFMIDQYAGCVAEPFESYTIIRQPTHAELTQHINDVLEGRVS